MDKYPLTVCQIVTWFPSKETLLEGSGSALFKSWSAIKDRSLLPVPTLTDPTQRVASTGGFEESLTSMALRGSDGKGISWRQVKVSTL